jgi:hypothetical protein
MPPRLATDQRVNEAHRATFLPRLEFAGALAPPRGAGSAQKRSTRVWSTFGIAQTCASTMSSSG